MRAMLFGVMGILAVCLVRPGTAASRDICQNPDSYDPRFHLVLRSASLNSNGSFVGIFELANRNVEPFIAMPGTRKSGIFVLDRHPNVIVEFKSLNSSWIAFPNLAGDFMPSPGQLVIEPGEAAIFSIDLVSRGTANLSASDLRVLIRLSSPSICLVSIPFHAIPLRQEVEGFATSAQ